MSGLQIIVKSLGMSDAQFSELMGHWYLAGFLDEAKLKPALLNYLQCDAEETARIISVIHACLRTAEVLPIAERNLVDFDAKKALLTLFPKEEQAGTALAMIELLQQNHFTKGERKEVSLAQETEYTRVHQSAILDLATLFNMVDPMPIIIKTDVALVIGARALTMYTYLQDLKAAIDARLVSHAFILLGSRPLITGVSNDLNNTNTDNPQQSDTFFFDSEAVYYQDYLSTKYPGEMLTEGLSMRDTFETIFGMTTEKAKATGKFHFIIDTPHSIAFYQASLQQAKTDKLISDRGNVVVFGIQPYLANYRAQAENLIAADADLAKLAITVTATGRSGNTSGKILSQALAMPIDTAYDRVIAELKVAGVTSLIDKSRLRLGGRDKAIYNDNIAQLIEVKYPRIHQLANNTKSKIVNQLWWVQQNTQFTPQADALYQAGNSWTQYLHREIPRALARIEILILLRSCNADNLDTLYEEFIQDQPGTDTLTKDSFRKLSRTCQALTDDAVEAQMLASVIAAVTLSPDAEKLADVKLGKGQWPYDSVQFSGRTIVQCGDMYPIYHTANESVKQRLHDCFPDDTRHWRHAFFLENSGCLDPLRKQIQTADNASKSQIKIGLQTWLTYWMVNCLGFEAHAKSMTGARFMTQSVYQRMELLNQAITRSMDEPDLNIFEEYATACLKEIDLNIGNKKLALFIVRIANMANCFNTDDALAIKTLIQQEGLLTVLDDHAKVFASDKVATYVPALLQNIYHEAANKPKALVLALNWVSKTMADSTAKITSFRTVDANMRAILHKHDFACNVVLNDKGEVATVQPEILQQVKSETVRNLV